jgi:DNA-binding FrmR family transcriptional regulator
MRLERSSATTGDVRRAPAHCHVPASFDPAAHADLLATSARLVRAVEWLRREIESGRECHAALTQVTVVQADVDQVRDRLLEGHLRYCLAPALAEGRDPDEIAALLAPVASLFGVTRRERA